MLNILHHGTNTTAPRLLIAHGLFGSARNWGVIAKRLSDRGEVLAVDMRNHGESPRGTTQTYADMAADLAEVIEQAGAPMDVLGHSMGGKAAMVLAVTRPDLLRRLIVADIAPVGYGHSQSHLIAAMQATGSDFASRQDADAALANHVDDASLRAFLLQSLDLKTREWRLNLDVLDREMASIVGFPQISGSFPGPVLFLTGADSSYVLPEHRPSIRGLFPHARFARIPGAGHWLHAEKPREFEATVRVFLDQP